MKISLPSKALWGGVALLVAGGIAFKTAGINDTGYRTVVQWPNGHTFVKFDEGLYWTFFGKTWKWPNVIPYEIEGTGFEVRYQDGGRGTVDGKMQVNLPNDEPTMLEINRTFHSAEGLTTRLLVPELTQALNLTAGLMTSEEAYATKRNDYREYAYDQIRQGTFQTETVEKEITLADGSSQEKNVAVIRYSPETGLPLHNDPVLQNYGLTVAAFQITDWDFAAATEQQIDSKRQAEMASIEAQAKADQANWEKERITAEGKRDVEKVRYEQLKIKEEAVIKAERQREVAVIAANQQVQVNEEALAAAKIDVQTAEEEAAALKLRKDAEAYGLRVVMEADGALDRKRATVEKVNEMWAKAYAIRPVPSIVMGGADGSGNTETGAQEFMSILTAKALKDLNTDLKVK